MNNAYSNCVVNPPEHSNCVVNPPEHAEYLNIRNVKFGINIQ